MSHTISVPSVLHHLIRRFNRHRGFSTKHPRRPSMAEYVLRCKHLLTTPPMILVPEKNRRETVRDEAVFGASRYKSQQPTTCWALRKQTQPDPMTIGSFRPFTLPWTGIDIPHLWIGRRTISRRTIHFIVCLSPPQGHQVKNTKARPMRLVIAWARIEESDIDPVIPAPSSDTKGKHRLNSLNNRDDYNSNY